MKHDLTLGLYGKVVIVTGAAGDIGRKTVELLLAHGDRMIAEDLSPAVKNLEQSGKVVSLSADVSKEESAKTAVSAAIERFGTLDILVNNAGKTLNKPMLETSAAEWVEIMAIDARGYFLHARSADHRARIRRKRCPGRPTDHIHSTGSVDQTLLGRAFSPSSERRRSHIY